VAGLLIPSNSSNSRRCSISLIALKSFISTSVPSAVGPNLYLKLRAAAKVAINKSFSVFEHAAQTQANQEVFL
jgi:hypothetical protein